MGTIYKEKELRRIITEQMMMELKKVLDSLKNI